MSVQFSTAIPNHGVQDKGSYQEARVSSTLFKVAAVALASLTGAAAMITVGAPLPVAIFAGAGAGIITALFFSATHVVFERDYSVPWWRGTHFRRPTFFRRGPPPHARSRSPGHPHGGSPSRSFFTDFFGGRSHRSSPAHVPGNSHGRPPGSRSTSASRPSSSSSTARGRRDETPGSSNRGTSRPAPRGPAPGGRTGGSSARTRTPPPSSRAGTRGPAPGRRR